MRQALLGEAEGEAPKHEAAAQPHLIAHASHQALPCAHHSMHAEHQKTTLECIQSASQQIAAHCWLFDHLHVHACGGAAGHPLLTCTSPACFKL